MKGKRTITTTLTVVNLITILIVAILFFGMYGFVSYNMNKIDIAITYLHNYSDYTQESKTILHRDYKLKDSEDLKIISKQFLENYNKTKNLILEIIPTKEIEISLAAKPVLEIYSSYKGGVDEEVIANDLESSFLSFLKLSKNITEYKDDMLRFSLYMSLAILFFVLIGVFFILRSILMTITKPLDLLTKEAESLSLSDKHTKISLDNSFYEYEVLTGAFKVMSERMQVQNRIEKQESGTSKAGELAENLAHTINNPLAIIGTSAKIINRLSKKSDAKVIENESAEILNSVTRITDTTHQIKSLIFSSDKVEETEFKISNIISAINLLYFSRLFNNDISLKIEADEEAYIKGKETIVLQIISALIESTIDFLIDDKIDEVKIITLRVKPSLGGITEIEILDNGRKIEEKLIQSYFRDISLKKMNFYTSNELAKENGYALSFETKPHKKFTLTLL